MKEKNDGEHTLWFVDAQSTSTNNYLMQFDAIELRRQVMCKDGELRNLYQLSSHRDIVRVQHDRDSLGLKLTYYFQPEGADVPERTTLPTLASRNNSRERRKAQKKTGELKKAQQLSNAPF